MYLVNIQRPVKNSELFSRHTLVTVLASGILEKRRGMS